MSNHNTKTIIQTINKPHEFSNLVEELLDRKVKIYIHSEIQNSGNKGRTEDER